MLSPVIAQSNEEKCYSLVQKYSDDFGFPSLPATYDDFFLNSDKRLSVYNDTILPDYIYPYEYYGNATSAFNFQNSFYIIRYDYWAVGDQTNFKFKSPNYITPWLKSKQFHVIFSNSRTNEFEGCTIGRLLPVPKDASPESIDSGKFYSERPSATYVDAQYGDETASGERFGVLYTRRLFPDANGNYFGELQSIYFVPASNVDAFNKQYSLFQLQSAIIEGGGRAEPEQLAQYAGDVAPPPTQPVSTSSQKIDSTLINILIVIFLIIVFLLFYHFYRK